MDCQQSRLRSAGADGADPDLDGGRCGGLEVQALIGANLRHLRKARGISSEHLANLAGVDISTLRALERGAVMPSIGMLWRLARELGVPCTAFIEARIPEALFKARPGDSSFIAVG